ncbi:Putative 1-phosphatidylinositol 3-phosphate 5-kinase [Eumeta japonica]|uniref:1-phosphatidylinositol 3-phosphate 5-kinase n=1 Tax=Eumeta variegata TaxID=151549 RepID=A0A4C1T5A0_EUMVA|nr:Putative 1-phosphatidylinositol 3-phosphate 5-kinase [Eumeta japonica]
MTCYTVIDVLPSAVLELPSVLALCYSHHIDISGHETFTSLSESEAEREYAAFKQHMETIHLALTSVSLQQHTTLAGLVRGLWSVRDRVIAGEKMLRDAHDKWAGPPPTPTPTKPSTKPAIENGNVDDKSDVEDSVTGDAGANESADTQPKNDSEHQGMAEEDEERGDKKTVRQILSQLLSNNQPSNQNGVIISGGLLPVVVFAGEIGSVVAATLASVQYQRQLHSLLFNGHQSEQDDIENSTLTSKDKTDGDKTKAKSNEHIEVLLKDGLLCKVYFAAQFHRLRALLLASLSDQGAPSAREHSEKEPPKQSLNDCKNLSEIEESFVRSLSRCVAWAARGGKSGSTFCKTTDDRYVLKEMSKLEWHQFLDFAPHYFNYVTSCHQNKVPSLLARIVGVYSVGGAGNGVLVMENLFYGRNISRRFDLKGSLRHRLAPDANAAGAVLMDENLLNLRWESQFYLASHTASVVWAGVERDTAFLAANDVMDYSLLLGLEGGKLVVGIIDYIRTFTWDKKLEHYVKKNLGSGQPTVVSPEQYRRRFVTAMKKYFLHCPTQWDDLHRGLVIQT